MPDRAAPPRTPRRLAPWVALAAIAALAATLWAEAVPSARGLLAYGVAATLSVGAIVLALRSKAAQGAPSWLAWSVAITFALRLAVALLLQRALPVYAYPVEYFQGGYIFQDAWVRDLNAWEVAGLRGSLAAAFDEGIKGDQYGSMVFLSALAYRALSSDLPRPILIVLFTAGASALATLFGWAFVHAKFGRLPSTVAAWTLALYPEAVLLGSSQMREPYLILGLALALWGVARVQQAEPGRGGWVAMLAGLTVGVVFSPPYAIVLLAIVLVVLLWERKGRPVIPRRIWIPIAGLTGLGLLLTLRAWSSLASAPQGNPLAVFGWWLSSDVPFQLREFARASGWADLIFQRTPEWSHIFLATGYGLVQPFLPAALADNTGAWIMSVLVGLKAAGWLVLLTVLIYGTGIAIRNGWNRLPFALALLSWMAILLASYRAVGDQWDNPRYRTISLVVYGALAGWGLSEAIRRRSPWLWRTAALVGTFHLVLFQWYLGRYYHTPRLSLENTLAASVLAVVVLGAGFLVSDARRRRRAGGLTGPRPAV